MAKIQNSLEFAEWFDRENVFKDAWAAVLCGRIALRVFPYGVPHGKEGLWAKRIVFTLVRSNGIAWAVNSNTDWSIGHEMGLAAARTYQNEGYNPSTTAEPAATVADASMYSVAAASHAAITDVDVTQYAVEAATAGHAALEFVNSKTHQAFWRAIEEDCAWLLGHAEPIKAAYQLNVSRLWPTTPPINWDAELQKAAANLLSFDDQGSYQEWIDWYERRIRGERAAFDIPGDNDQKEDKKILRRLAEATDEDFWGKGHEYVNATLKGWLDEARARVASPLPEIEAEIEIPSPEPHAIAYGMNIDGMIDRLPSKDQKHLQGTPQQRRAYGDIRELANALLDENQRLGSRLYAAMERFCGSLPDSFEEADTYLVWRDGNALRRLYLAHRKVEARNEPDEARLEAVVAEMLGGLLDLYNVFAFADDGLRIQDEDRITLQERADGKAEAMAAAPIIRAILAKPKLASDAALQDIKSEVENAKLPADDPYADQALVQSNRINRNLMVVVLKWMNESFGNPNTFRGAVAVSVTGSAMVAGGATLFGVAGGTNFLPMLEFVAVQASPLQHYVSIAYSSYPHLPELIERAKAIWQHFSGKV